MGGAGADAQGPAVLRDVGQARDAGEMHDVGDDLAPLHPPDQLDPARHEDRPRMRGVQHQRLRHAPRLVQAEGRDLGVAAEADEPMGHAWPCGRISMRSVEALGGASAAARITAATSSGASQGKGSAA